MSNMSYCRFENTMRDLEDCQEHLNDKLDSEYEISSRVRLIEICRNIAKEMEDEDLDKLPKGKEDEE